MRALANSSVAEPAPRERRSLFANYARLADPQPETPASGPVADATDVPVRHDRPEVVAARCLLYQFLARAFEYPHVATWKWLCFPETRAALTEAARVVDESEARNLCRAVANTAKTIVPQAFATYHDDYVAAIGHAARGSSPINEIEYGDAKADPLFQPHRLADLAAFYRAFGLELTEDGGERHDHLGVELEFMAVLTGQEARSLELGHTDEVLGINLEAQRLFLRHHLGRWVPLFARRLGSMAGDGALRAMANLLLAFVSEECRRAGVPAGASDVTLRLADEGASLCESCGLHEALPGDMARNET